MRHDHDWPPSTLTPSSRLVDIRTAVENRPRLFADDVRESEGNVVGSTAEVLVERAGETLVLTLNRPEKLNAINYSMIGTLLEQVHEAATDDSIRAVLLTGSGRAFSAGDDVKGMGTPVR